MAQDEVKRALRVLGKATNIELQAYLASIGQSPFIDRAISKLVAKQEILFYKIKNPLRGPMRRVYYLPEYPPMEIQQVVSMQRRL